MDFDEDESNKDRVCSAINNIYFDQSDLKTQAELQTKLGPNRLFQGMMKRSKSSNWQQCSEAEKKDSNNTKIHWSYTMESSSEVLFLSFQPNNDSWVLAKAHETHPEKNATEFEW